MTNMYIIMGILLIIAILFLLIFHWKKKRIIKKICAMSMCYKCQLLNELTEPLGYYYDPTQDLFTNYNDAWQKVYGYGEIYDRLAPRFHMIFDSLPLYFDYRGKTWLIEFWKGQYGINAGCEAGIYHADTVIPPSARPLTIFSAAEDSDCPEIDLRLYHKGHFCASLEKSQWWLTLFRMGCFSQPEALCVGVSINFPDYEMRDAFLDALADSGYDMNLTKVSCTRVCFVFCQCGHHTCDHSARKGHTCKRCIFRQITCFFTMLYRRFVQCVNRLFCLLYCFVTRPFNNTCDKLLYLYYYLPFAFRRMLRLKRFRRKPYKPLKEKGSRSV